MKFQREKWLIFVSIIEKPGNLTARPEAYHSDICT
jgi:hypothetical protein